MVVVDFHIGTQSMTLRRNLHAGAGKISIVTQCDVKRFRERIPEMMRVWRGPMVVVVMMRSMAEMDDVLTTVKENRFLTQWVDVHLVIPETYPGVLYPINALRSLAEQWALTEWVFVLDADLVPNANAQVFDQVLRQALVHYIPQWRQQEIQHNRCPCETQLLAFAVTALEWKKAVVRPPANLHQRYWFDKTQALCMVQHDLLKPFKAGGLYIGTDPARWLTSSEPYEDLYYKMHEPYHIVRTGSPHFSAEFCGHGLDKVSRLSDLFMAGYTLHVLPEVAVTHRPHSFSASFAGQRPGVDETREMWVAMMKNRAHAYFSTAADGTAWYTHRAKSDDGSLFHSFLQQVRSKEATTANYDKCMRSGTSAQPLAARL